MSFGHATKSRTQLRLKRLSTMCDGPLAHLLAFEEKVELPFVELAFVDA